MYRILTSEQGTIVAVQTIGATTSTLTSTYVSPLTVTYYDVECTCLRSSVTLITSTATVTTIGSPTSIASLQTPYSSPSTVTVFQSSSCPSPVTIFQSGCPATVAVPKTSTLKTWSTASISNSVGTTKTSTHSTALYMPSAAHSTGAASKANRVVAAQLGGFLLTLVGFGVFL